MTAANAKSLLPCQALLLVIHQVFTQNTLHTSMISSSLHSARLNISNCNRFNKQLHYGFLEAWF